MRTEIPFGYYTTDEYGRYHSYNDEPAVVVETHMEENESQELIECQGYKAWYKDGQIHRDNDLPAVIHDSGKKFWYNNGNFIREE